MITAPYNFVPLNKEVFYPSWSEDVSHDVPFADGESGEIDITITAKSPIFIRDHEKNEEFCQHNGEYYIPSSSVKGMVRNILEIISFSKMRDENFDNDTYAVRDLSKADNFYMIKMKPENICCGWLKKDGDKYKIEDCGTPGRINHKEIDKALNVSFASNFSKEGFEKTSKHKYSLVQNIIHTINVDGPFTSKTNAKYDKREFFNFDQNSIQQGQLVLTGQPTPRRILVKWEMGKDLNFYFLIQKEN